MGMSVADAFVGGSDQIANGIITLGKFAPGNEQGDIIYFDGSAWQFLPPGANNTFLKSSGPATNPSWQSVSSTISFPGQAQGDIIYFDGANWNILHAGAAGTFLQTQGAGANPQWAATSTSISFPGQTQGDIIYFDGMAWNILHAGSAGQTLQSGGVGQNPFWDLPSNFDIPLQAQGDILYFDGAIWTRLPAGLAGQVLQTNGAGANPAWVNPTGAGSTILGQTTLGGAATSVSVTFTAKKNLEFRLNGKMAASAQLQITFNNDNAANYCHTNFSWQNTSSTSSNTNDTAVTTIFASTDTVMMQGDINNTQTSNKNGTVQVSDHASGAASTPRGSMISFLWANAANQITTIKITASVANALAAGTELTVIGYD